jgi:nitrate/TMAO reductase-like tetraheme cytochrome c subunit
MKNNMKIINIFSIALLILFSSELLRAGELGLPELDELQDSYLKGSREERSQQCRKEVASLFGGKCTSCHNDDVTEFTEKGNKAKEDMMAASAIGVKCDYCHTGKKQYTDKFEMAVNMFELSEMMDVECNFCHKGKKILTTQGQTSKTAMLVENWVETGNEKCLECHIEKKQFELNSHGQNALKTLMCE